MNTTASYCEQNLYYGQARPFMKMISSFKGLLTSKNRRMHLMTEIFVINKCNSVFKIRIILYMKCIYSPSNDDVRQV
jgi:hypothetical protein